MNNYIFILTLMFVFAFEGLSQTVSRNSQGEMIVVFDDGSWRYYESSDSTLLKEDANTQSETENSEAQDGNNQKSRKKDKSVSKSYLLSVVDPNRPLPAYPCVETFSGVDDYSKRKRVDLQKEILFEYSDPEVATYLKGRSYVSCEAGLVGFVGDVRVLSIRITVASRMARADYGYLSNNTLMSIKLINGETVTLFASGSDLGLIDNENNQTVYRASFQISRESQKILTSSPIDKIKIVWSTGYEEYPVTNVDFFMNQIRCLASK